MERIVKRVPIDFNESIDEIEVKYSNPHHKKYRECSVCGGTGYSDAAKKLCEPVKLCWEDAKKICKAAKIEIECPACSGNSFRYVWENDDEKLSKEWVPPEIPKGDGYQVWEFTEGKIYPITPVFMTSEDLIQHIIYRMM